MGVHWDLQEQLATYGKAGLKMLGYRPDEDVFHTKQPFFPGFYFNDKAKALTREALFEELPGLIFGYADAISFLSLFSSISNEPPRRAR